MPGINATVSHALPQAEATRRMQQLLGTVKGEYSGKIIGTAALVATWQPA